MSVVGLPGKVVRRIRSKAQQIADRISVRGLILAYHRVADLDTDPQLLAVSPENFIQHLEVIQRHYVPASLSDIASGGRRHPPLISLTFDDGYVDNFQYAFPILDAANVPATFFVTSGFVDNDHEFYWDELERLLLQPPVCFGTLALEVGSQKLSWDFDRADDWNPQMPWNVTLPGYPSNRHKAYATLCSQMKFLPDAKRQVLLDQIAAFVGKNRQGRVENRVMKSQEISAIGRSGLIEIGAHTVTHPSMPTLSDGELANELTESKSRIESICGRSVTSFAFPYGEQCDFHAAAVDAVGRAGFQQACINCPGLLVRRSSRMMLPRFIVRNWNGDEFARQLQSWMHHRTAVYT